MLTATGDTLGTTLDWWETSDRRRAARARLAVGGAVDPDDVIMTPDAARRAGLTSTVVFPARQPRAGRVGDQGDGDRSIGRSDDDGVYRHRGPARVFVDERDGDRARSRASTRARRFERATSSC